jgi:hypothetical protein
MYKLVVLLTGLLLPKFFIHQQMHFLLILENSKIYIEKY